MTEGIPARPGPPAEGAEVSTHRLYWDRLLSPQRYRNHVVQGEDAGEEIVGEHTAGDHHVAEHAANEDGVGKNSAGHHGAEKNTAAANLADAEATGESTRAITGSGRQGRSAFEKDYHRIIISASFRRLQDKTQVFPLDQSDFIRTRLTHSLEVSSLAKSLGQRAMSRLSREGGPYAPTNEQRQDAADILLCAGLLHDIGNPPFGHYGETTIRAWFREHLPRLRYKGVPLTQVLDPAMQADLLHYEGNAQALRLLSKLHYVVDEYGMNLTYGVLNTLIKNPVPSTGIDPASEAVERHKLGYFQAERELFAAIAGTTGTAWREATVPTEVVEDEGPEPGESRQLRLSLGEGTLRTCRHPLTYLLEAADDISYRTADIEDAHRKDKLTYGEIRDALYHTPRVNDYPEEVVARFGELRGALDDFLEATSKKRLQRPQQYAIQNWLIRAQSLLIKDVTDTFCRSIDAIMHGTFRGDLFEGRLAGLVLDVLGDLAYEHVFTSRMIVSLEVAADAVIGGLLDKFVPACIHYDTDQALSPVDYRLMSLVSDNYKHSYHFYAAGADEHKALYLRLLLITDYICGMTDSYAKDLFHKLNGIY